MDFDGGFDLIDYGLNCDFSLWDPWTASIGTFPSAISPYEQTSLGLQQTPGLAAPAAVPQVGLVNQTAGVPVRQQTTFSSLSGPEQDALLKQIGIDRSQVASPAHIQQSQQFQQQQQQQHHAVAAAPVIAAAPVAAPQYQQVQQAPVEQQQQYVAVPEAPPHYSNRYPAPDAAPQPQQAQYQQYHAQLPQRLFFYFI